ncbi:hypothetical protein SGO_2093 [Streptococcus gordonii str. Challis substr. CH1]|uniref:Uncharacterized protein n=1 Tax=Streptococcus gordonii (strain Challis / ATCC 35105 / BCRC 15272 / CH1 / DL1 / V288) TaxID=467705 RepID=A8AZY1_STRGC|nr:hypothetical protein SGO_2093 [Streptococcus gordonii str. Challis substr. CH1]
MYFFIHLLYVIFLENSTYIIREIYWKNQSLEIIKFVLPYFFRFKWHKTNDCDII